MALGYGLQMATIVQPSNRMDVSTRQELKNKIELSTRIQASTFVRADCATQVQVLQALIASSRIVVETDAGEEDLAEIAEIAEGDYDSEVDFIDDDEIRDEDDSSARFHSTWLRDSDCRKGTGSVGVHSAPQPVVGISSQWI